MKITIIALAYLLTFGVPRAGIGPPNGVGSGTVTSVNNSDGSTVPIYTPSGGPVTSSGTLTQTLLTQLANQVFAGPTSGGAAQPGFRALVAADLPAGLTSTTPSAGQILLGNAGGTAYAATSVSGDATLASTGALTVTKTNGVAFGTFATQSYAAPPTFGPLTVQTPLTVLGTTGVTSAVQ